MAEKRKSGASGVSKKRRAITMETKMEIIKRAEKGETPTEISRALDIPRTTIVGISKDKVRIQEHVKGSAPMQSTVITKQRVGLIAQVEKLLIIWLEGQNQRRAPVSLGIIQEKARSLYDDLKKQQGESSNAEPFKASRGWFMRFKARANLHNIKVSGEAANAVEQASCAFPGTLAEIIEEGGYCAQQVFNVGETGLFWKKMPSRTYIAKEEKSVPGYKAAKDRLTLLLGAHAASDFKNVVEMGKELNLDAAPEDVDELLTSHSEELTNEDLIELEQQKVAEEEEDAPTVEEASPRKVLTTKVLAEAFRYLEAAMSLFEEHDPNTERSASVNRGISNMYSCYREIYKQKRRTSVPTSLGAFFKKASKTPEKPAAKTSEKTRAKNPLKSPTKSSSKSPAKSPQRCPSKSI
ncbi:uncharacterized protein C7orf50 homolog isoform X1 [Alligator mississippiensis]|uniref:uncharacterized protein C7orf50 homolog isoform X1 n=1 Tax=Alligator mississippiensis TaxID=8496 RepID=UPI002877C0BB|nr:uncharacterized protein C7orf50 homolog isoform X1 [Alligator mississippiensis]